MKLTLGFSPCPNDTFMMDAMIHHKIDTAEFEFNLIIEDVEELNQKALQGDLDITKLSYHTFLHTNDKYRLLDAGSALGHGVGPLLIANEQLKEEQILEGPVALPGEWTTAHWLFSLRYPSCNNKSFMIFSDVERAVKNGEVAAGVIIHENRFTYGERGFTKLIDLGEYWEEQTSMLIPLGGIAIHKRIPEILQRKINSILKASIAYAFDNPESSHDFVSKYAQEMNPEVMQKHIDLYVNKYSLSLGVEGRKAVKALFEMSVTAGLIQSYDPNYSVSI